MALEVVGSSPPRQRRVFLLHQAHREFQQTGKYKERVADRYNLPGDRVRVSYSFWDGHFSQDLGRFTNRPYVPVIATGPVIVSTSRYFLWRVQGRFVNRPWTLDISSQKGEIPPAPQRGAAYQPGVQPRGDVAPHSGVLKERRIDIDHTQVLCSR